MRVGGVLLAGGLSRRMGGKEKAQLRIGGRPLIQHVATRVLSQRIDDAEGGASRPLDWLAVNANGSAARFEFLGLPIIADTIPGFVGPLAGVLAGIDYARIRQPATTHLFTAPIDAPFLPDDLVWRLTAALRDTGADLAVAVSGGRRHPTIALWSLSLADQIRQAIMAGKYSVGAAQLALSTASVAWPVEPFDPFFNINDPASFAEAERLFQVYDKAFSTTPMRPSV